MASNDFILRAQGPGPNGTTIFTIEIVAAAATRHYEYDPSTGFVRITGPERTIRVAGHDMTSIIGKRVREWLVARGLVRLPTPPAD